MVDVHRLATSTGEGSRIIGVVGGRSTRRRDWNKMWLKNTQKLGQSFSVIVARIKVSVHELSSYHWKSGCIDNNNTFCLHFQPIFSTILWDLMARHYWKFFTAHRTCCLDCGREGRDAELDDRDAILSRLNVTADWMTAGWKWNRIRKWWKISY